MDCRPLDLVAELTDAVLFCEARIQREGLILSLIHICIDRAIGPNLDGQLVVIDCLANTGAQGEL